MHFPTRPETEPPAPEQITSGLGPYSSAAADRTGRIVAAGGPVRSAIWSLPIDSETAQVHGAMSALVVEGTRQIIASMTADGARMVYRATDPRGVERWILQSLGSGRESVIGLASMLDSVLLTPDGRWAWIVPSSEGRNLDISHLVTLPPDIGVRLLSGPEGRWDISRDGTQVLAAAYTRPRSVNLRGLRVQ